MTISRIAKVAAVWLVVVAPAWAQSRSEIRFDRGSSSAVVNGSVTGHDYVDYTLGASAGQTMSVTLNVVGGTGDAGTAYFNILPPGSDDVAIFNGSMSDGPTGEATLPDTGNYTIRVYLMGNDEDAGKTVDYTLEVAIH